MSTRPSLQTAVVMRRERITGPMSRWQPWRWVLHDVLLSQEPAGTPPRLLREDASQALWLHPGFTVTLFKDDAEGYYLNATTPAPCWFVLWRMEEQATFGDTPMAVPAMVSLSYHDAGRWLDAQETVEQVPAPPEVMAWMADFAQTHWVEEPRRRKRPESFKGLQDRFGQPVSVSTGKRHGGE